MISIDPFTKEPGRLLNGWQRSVVVICLLLFVLWQGMTHSGPLERIATVILLLSYCSIFVAIHFTTLAQRLSKYYTIAVLWVCLATSIPFMFFPDFYQGLYALLFLIGFIGTRIPGTLSIQLAIVTFCVAGIILLAVNPFGLDGNVGYTFGLLGCYAGTRGRYNRRQAEVLRQLHLAELQAAHHELQIAHEKLQEAAVQSMHYVVLAERERIARDIHDSVGHGLTSIIVQLQAMRFMADHDVARLDATISDVLTVARKSLAEVRNSVHGLTEDGPAFGVIAMQALISQVQNANPQIKFHFEASDITDDVELETGVVLYRVLQESITNIIRYAEATLVNIHLTDHTDSVELSISDDGRITTDTLPTFGFGLTGMQARCTAIGGSFTLAANSPHGLRITAKLPHQGVGTSEYNGTDGAK